MEQLQPSGGLAEATTAVVVPCHNSADTLPRAVHSVLAQRTADFRLIIVDDGSTDDSCVVAQQLAAGDRRREASQPLRGRAKRGKTLR